MTQEVRILLLTREPYPTVRPAITFCFGTYMAEFGARTTLATWRDPAAPAAVSGQGAPVVWNGGGELLLHQNAASRFGRVLGRFAADLSVLWRRMRDHDVVVLRDKILVGLAAVLLGRMFGRTVVYWLSFPYPEDDLLRSRVQGRSLGLARLAYTWLRGHLTMFVLYRLVLPMADHSFVISERMRELLIQRGVPADKMTAYPMGVDMRLADSIPTITSGTSGPDGADWPTEFAALADKKIIIYLGALDRTRKIDFFFETLKLVREREPQAVLLLVGDAQEPADRAWLESRAREVGVADSVVWTGWLKRETAWTLAKAAHVGVCAVPEGYVFETMSPTKAVELLALGTPVVVDGQPDQAMLTRESGGGMVVEDKRPESFARAILTILTDPDRRGMGLRGREHVRRVRDYRAMSEWLVGLLRGFVEKTKGRRG